METPPPDSRPKQRGRQPMHGHHQLKRLVSEVAARGLKVIDRRYAIGKEGQRWRNGLIASLGGADVVSDQALTIIDAAEVTRLMLRHIDSWIAMQPSIINKKRRSLHPIVMQRQGLADSLVRSMIALGLERRARDVPTLSDVVRQIKEEQPR